MLVEIALSAPLLQALPPVPLTMLERAVDPRVLREWLAKLDQRLAKRPTDHGLLMKRADLLRALGDLGAAAAIYREFAETGEQARFSTILDGGIPDWTDSAGPAPFVRLSKVLTAKEQLQLWQEVQKSQSTLRAASVGNGLEGRIDTDVRQADRLSDTQRVHGWFLPRLEAVIERSGAVARLGLEMIPAGKRELQVTNHGHGGFFHMHRDTGEGQTGLRGLTYVYYFHREPSRFTGGDLLLFDQTVTGERADIVSFTRLAPQPNSVILFRPDRLHAVTRIFSDSTDPLDGRWTVNGWFHQLRLDSVTAS